MSHLGYKLLVDWDNDGAYTEANDDITSRVLSLAWKTGRDYGSQLLGRSSAGTLEALLENDDGFFNHFNTASAINGKILPGRPIRACMLPKSARFTAANSEYLSVADNATLSTGDIDFTWAGWVYLESTTGSNQFVFSKGVTADNSEYRLFYNHSLSRFRFQVGAGASSASVNADTLGAPATGRWYFIVVWHDSTANTVNIQVNDGGVDSVSTGAVTPADNASALHLGAIETPFLYLDGRVANLMFTKELLTAKEKSWLWNHGSGREYVETGLDGDGKDLRDNMVSWWILDESSGSRADAHGSNTLADNATVTQADGPPRAVWSGFLESIEPNPGLGGIHKARLRAFGPLGKIRERKVTIAMQTDIKTGSAVDLILDEIGWGAGSANRDIDPGVTEMTRWFIDRDRNALEAIRDLENDELGFLRETVHGGIAFESRQRRMSAVTLTTLSDAAAATMPYQAIRQADPLKEVANRVPINVEIFSTDAEATLWSHPETGTNSPSIGPGKTLEVFASYPNPQSPTDAFAVDAWTDLVSATDYAAFSDPLGSGVNLTADLAIRPANLSKFDKAMKIPLSNIGTNNMFVTKLQARGTAVRKLDPGRVIKEDATSQAAYGERDYPTPPKHLKSTRIAGEYGGAVLARHKDTHPVLAVTVAGHKDTDRLRQARATEISDRVQLIGSGNADLGVAGDFFVESLRHRVSRGGHHHLFEYELSVQSVVTSGWALSVGALSASTILTF